MCCCSTRRPRFSWCTPLRRRRAWRFDHAGSSCLFGRDGRTRSAASARDRRALVRCALQRTSRDSPSHSGRRVRSNRCIRGAIRWSSRHPCRQVSPQGLTASPRCPRRLLGHKGTVRGQDGQAVSSLLDHRGAQAFSDPCGPNSRVPSLSSRQSARSTEGGSKGSTQHPNQRSVANLLRLDESRTDKCRDRGLLLKE